MEDKLKELAKTIVNYSIKVQEKENVLITAPLISKPLIKELIKEIEENGAHAFVKLTDNEISAWLLEGSTEERIKEQEKILMHEVETFQAFINISGSTNDYEAKNVSATVHEFIAKHIKKSKDIRINERKWVLLRYPTELDAHKAKMSTEDFTNFAFNVMTVDYLKLKKNIAPLKKLMEKTDKVRIKGPGTDLTFSIKDRPIIPCVGTHNIPDGEIYCAPVKDSVNGHITYNTPSPYRGNVFNNIKLTFKNGKIVKVKADNDQKVLEEIFDTDPGARYIGEFSIGLNPEIKHPMGDILYDEKITGSIHFTPGQAYRDSYNGNDSSIHWDLVLIQRPEYGGGEIYFDDKLIRKDGIFILEELKALNPKE